MLALADDGFEVTQFFFGLFRQPRAQVALNEPNVDERLGLGTTVAPPIVGETRPPDYRDRYESLTGVSLRACPVCPDGHMIMTECLRRTRPYPARPDTS